MFTFTGILQAFRILYRNVAIKGRSTRFVIKLYGEGIARATLDLPRPWEVRAGERVNLGVPHIGLFYMLQAHPFAITWWEDDATGHAISISLLLRARSGFTRKLLDRLEPGRECWAWIDGPFGPSSVNSFGFSGEMGDYGHIFMVATGIGIAAQLPYIKELLDRRRKGLVRTQKVSLVWQLEQSGDWEGAHEWLQTLVKEDNGYVSTAASWTRRILN
jgi:predicted ferric reductase